MLQHRCLSASHLGSRIRAERKSSAETSVKISVTETVLQCCESWFTRAVARRNAFDVECVSQICHHLSDDIVRGDDKVETASNELNFDVDSSRCLDDLFNAWM